MVESPCRNICTVEGSQCRACGRTLDEIANWSMMTDEERADVMERVAESEDESDSAE